jgi:predicted phage terminase large subunit-like protein
LIIELIGREGDDVHLTTASTYANLDHLAPSFKKQILQYEGTKLGRQEIYAEIIDPEEGGIVQREWFKLWPADKPIPRLEFVIQSYDCAFTEKAHNDPTAAITFGVFKPMDGGMSVLIMDCWQDRLQYPDLKPKVIDEYETVFGEGKDKKRVDLVLVEDKAAGISLIQDLQRAHIPARAYNPGRADKVQRLSIVANIIRAGRVWVPESTNRKGYVRDWAEGMVSQVCSFPNTDHDDFCVDADSLVAMADGSLKRIADVVVGEMVKTPAGSRRVVGVHENGIKEVWKVQTDGRELLATANHEVFTDKGWTRIDCLSQAVHNVCVNERGGAWHFKGSLGLRWSRLSSMAAGITGTLKAAIQRIGGTSPGLGTGCIEMCGSFTTAQSHEGCTSITSMGTRQTTRLPIWNAYQKRTTGGITGPQSEQTDNASTLRPSGLKQRNGTDLKKEGLGTESMPKRLWQRLGASLECFLASPSSAFGVALKRRQSPSSSGSAGQPANLQSPSFVSVKAVHNTHTMRPVFDLTVEGEHCYYANGILVHNCDALSQALRYLRDAGFLNIDPPPPDYLDEEDYIDAGMSRRTENPYAV